MRATLLFTALVGMAVASPIAAPNPQVIDFAEFDVAPVPARTGPPINAVSDPVEYRIASASAAAAEAAATDPATVPGKVKRDGDDCKPLPAGSGPVPSPDVDSAFLGYRGYADAANGALTPQGYVRSFVNLQGATERLPYLGYYTLTGYDTVRCQQYCDAADACYGFNVYVERDPSVNPAPGCANPPSTVNYKCSLWGALVDDSTATNGGQWRQDFHVVVAGSNGYSKSGPPPSYANFTGPVELGGAINAPSGYMGSKYYAGPYDPSQCAAACQATTAYDRRHRSSAAGYDACNFFNSYVLSKDGVARGTYCAMYTSAWPKPYSTNYGQYRGSNYYAVGQSYGYVLTVPDPGHD